MFRFMFRFMFMLRVTGYGLQVTGLVMFKVIFSVRVRLRSG